MGVQLRRIGLLEQVSGDPFAAQLAFLSNFDGTDEGTDAVDEANGLAITFNGNAALSNTETYGAEWGTSLFIPSTADDYVEVDVSSVFATGTNPWTIEVRLRKTTDPGVSENDEVLEAGPLATTDRHLFIGSHPDRLRYGDNRNGSVGDRLSTPSTVADDTWYEYAVTYDGARLEHYLGGVHLGGLTPTFANISTVERFAFGARLDGSDALWSGYIQAIRITQADRYGGNDYTPVSGKWSA